MQRLTHVLPTVLVTLLFIPSHSLESNQPSETPPPQEVSVVTVEPEVDFVHVNPEEDELVGEKAGPDEDLEVCNCWQYVMNTLATTTSMASIQPNADPDIGVVAIEWFGDVKHVSIVVAVTAQGVLVHETNYRHCQFTERFIKFSSHRLDGFWKP